MTETGVRVWQKLSRREREYLALLCDGLPNETIAARVGVNADTVKGTLRSLYLKTGMSTRLEVVIFAFAHGLVACPCGARGLGVGA